MDLLTTDWPQSLSSSTTGPATVTLGDGLPIHDLLSIIGKQLENMKTVMTSQVEAITEIKTNQNENNDNNSKLNERITTLENGEAISKLISQVEGHEKLLEELQGRPIIDPEQTSRLEGVEKKLASFYGDDTNILGRVGYLENGRLTDQQSLAQTMSQVKHLSDQLNSLKRQHQELKEKQKNPDAQNQNQIETRPSHVFEDQLRALQELRKDDLLKMKDLINFVANDLHKDFKGLQTIVTQQQSEINLLKQQQQQQQQQQQRPQTVPQSPTPAPQSPYPHASSPQALDEISRRVLTLEIRMNHLSNPSLSSPSPSSHPSAVTTTTTPLFTENLKQQISENEKTLYEALVKLDKVTSQCDDQKRSLEDMKRMTDLKFKQQQSQSDNQQTETDHLNQLIRDIDRKTQQLERKFQELSRVSTPPATPHAPTPAAAAAPVMLSPSTPLAESGIKSLDQQLQREQQRDQQLNHRLKTICEELQTSLQSLRNEMKSKFQDIEFLFEKSVLPCEGCGGAMPGEGITNLLLATTPATASPGAAPGPGPAATAASGMLDTTGSLPLGGSGGGGAGGGGAGGGGGGHGYTPSPSLMNQRPCSRRCPACLDRLGLTSFTTKEMMERLNEVSEYLNKVNKKLKTQSDKLHSISHRQEQVGLLVEEVLSDKVLNVIPKDLQQLHESKIDREGCTALIIEILRQYLPASVSGEGGGLLFGGAMSSIEIKDLLNELRIDFVTLHTTTKDIIEEEIKKLQKQFKGNVSMIQTQQEDIQSLSELSQKIHQSLLTYATNGRGGGTGAGDGRGTSGPHNHGTPTNTNSNTSPSQREGVSEYFGFDPEMKMAIRDLRERLEKIGERLDGCEGSQLLTEENLKKLRALVDTTREETKTHFKDHTQQLQHIKATHLPGREIENRIQHSISHLDPQIFHKDRILEMKDELERLKRYEKILEKKISNQGEHVYEMIDEHKRITAEDQKKLEMKLRAMTNEILSHLENHPTAHFGATGASTGTLGMTTGGGTGTGTGFVPSFPSSPALYRPHLSSTAGTGGGGGGGGGMYPGEDSPSQSNSNSSPKLRTFPEAFRRNVQGPLSPQEIASPSFSPEFNDEIEKQNEFRDQLDFEDYVRQTLNPLPFAATDHDKKKKKTAGNHGLSSSTSASSLPRPKSAHSSSSAKKQSWNPRAYS